MAADGVKRLLQEALRLNIGSGIAADFGNLDELFSGQTPNELFLGFEQHAPQAKAIDSASFFDLASLTKVLATTTLAMRKVECGQLSLDDSLGGLLPDVCTQNSTIAKITVRHLLSHTSGLPAWIPFYESMKNHFGDALAFSPLRDREAFFDSLLYEVKAIRAPGEQVVYSDLGFLYLEKVLSPHFEREVMKIWSEIPGSCLHFRPVLQSAYLERFRNASRGVSFVATEDCPWRGLIQGQVHDDNTWSKGGIAGHAGAFGRLVDVQSWVRSIMNGDLISRRVLQDFSKEVERPQNARRALGFDLPSLDGSGSTGNSFSPQSIGHLGFTGTSVWVDLDEGRYAILLTNRVHPSRNDTRIRELRREFHRLAMYHLRYV